MQQESKRVHVLQTVGYEDVLLVVSAMGKRLH
jgi:hypothetical protein